VTEPTEEPLPSQEWGEFDLPYSPEEVEEMLELLQNQ
jgi:hypothetical protein